MRSVWWSALILLLTFRAAPAEQFHDPHETDDVAWHVDSDGSTVRVAAQLRQSERVRQGRSAERIDLVAARDGVPVHIEHALPRAILIEDLRATLSLQSSRLGIRLGFRVVLPEEIDPRTGQPLAVFVPGDQYRRQNEWQTLSCTAGHRDLEGALRLLRAQLNRPHLDDRNAYADRIVVKAELPRGVTSLWLDDLHVDGIISGDRAGGRGVVQVSDQQIGEPRARLVHGRLTVGDQPFFPRIVPYHGEDPALLKSMGFNTVWVRDYRDQNLIQSLRSHGLYVMAIPPRPEAPGGRPLDARQVTLAPFNDHSDAVLLWYLGTQIPPESHTQLTAWTSQVADADHRFNRPILADVSGAERLYSHHLAMIASSRPVTNTSCSYRDYRDWLEKKRLTCLLGSFFWTWIDVESGASPRSLLERTGGNRITVEPEQLRLQVYAALSSGCRGLGFWSRSSLAGDDPASVETRLILSQLNREIELLSTLLIDGRPGGTVACQFLPETAPGKNNQTLKDEARFTGGLGSGRVPRSHTKPAADETPSDETPAAALFRARAGNFQLILPVWYDKSSQYVPGRMAGRNLSFIAPPGTDAATAWLVTASGISALEANSMAGGTRIVIPHFDQTAAVIITSDRNLISQLRFRFQHLVRENAVDMVGLSRAKWERVRQVDAELTELGHGRPSAGPLLAQARQWIEDAERSLKQNNYQGAVVAAGNVLQTLRVLQHEHWQHAVDNLTSPAASPYTVCFQTLPEHYRLLQLVGDKRDYQVRSRLASGTFENVQQMVQDGWQHSQASVEGVQATAELIQSAPPDSPGQYCLRLAAVPVDPQQPPVLLDRQPVTVSTPPLKVAAGDILHITGWSRVRFPSEERLDRALFYDNLTGESGSLRFGRNADWQRFELLRDVDRDGYFQLSFALEGLGELQIDDVRITSLQTRTPAEPPMTVPPETGPSFRDRARDLFNRIPGVDRLPGLNAPE